MSKQNKVNPGMYTQAGRLTPDDTARELKKQREAAAPNRDADRALGTEARSAKVAQPHKHEPNRVTKKDKADEETSPKTVLKSKKLSRRSGERNAA
jgi:hypothetical protein